MMRLKVCMAVILGVIVGAGSYDAWSVVIADKAVGEQAICASPSTLKHGVLTEHDKKMQWWREAKFGCFMHWGVYSQLEGIWNGKPVKGYAEHIQRSQKITQDEYRRAAVEKFNPVEFDADRWVKMIKQAGMRYLIITAKHHDGFAMYDSKVSDYNIVKQTPFHRDPMRELRDACKRQGIRFGFYYSHAFDWGDPNGPGNDWEWENPGGDRHLFGGRKWWEAHPELIENIHKNYVEKKSIPQIRELLTIYKPDIMWFDTPHKLPPEDNREIMEFVRKIAPDVIVNGRLRKAGDFKDGGGDYKNTCDRPAEFYPVDGDWEAIPTTNESYGYHCMDKSHKPSAHFIKLISKAAARGGNLLMNIGPKGDGTIDKVDREILKGIGAWMWVNGVAIYATQKTVLPVHAWGESTIKGDTLYLHIHNFPKDNILVLGGLKTEISKVRVLSDKTGAGLRFEREPSGDVKIHLPAGLSKEVVPVLALECRGEIECDSVRLISPTQVNRLHVFDGQTGGGNLSYGAGKVRDSYVKNWKKKADYVLWRNRIETATEFNLFVVYDSDKKSGENSYEVQIAGQTFTQKVLPGVVNKKILLGKVRLEKGDVNIKVQTHELVSKELFKLRAVILEP